MAKFTPADISELQQHFQKAGNSTTSLPSFKDAGDSRLVDVTDAKGNIALYYYKNGKAMQVSLGNIVTPNPNPVIGNAQVSGGGVGAKAAEVVIVLLTAGVAYTATFPQPSLLMQLPDCYATQDGVFTRPIGYSITLNEPTGFTITPISDCTMRYVIQHTS